MALVGNEPACPSGIDLIGGSAVRKDVTVQPQRLRASARRRSIASSALRRLLGAVLLLLVSAGGTTTPNDRGLGLALRTKLLSVVGFDTLLGKFVRAPLPAAPAATLAKYVSTTGGHVTLDFAGGKAYAAGPRGQLVLFGTLSAPVPLNTSLAQAALWRLRMSRHAPAPRRYKYSLVSTGTRANCGCTAHKGAAKQCRNGTLVLTCGAPRTSFTATERGCITSIAYATTELCPDSLDTVAVVRPANGSAPKDSSHGRHGSKVDTDAGVAVAFVRYACLVMAALWLLWLVHRIAAPRTRLGGVRNNAQGVPDCPVCLMPIAGAVATCSSAAGHAVCAGCLHSQVRVHVRDLANAIVGGAPAAAAAPAQLAAHFMACPVCPAANGVTFSFASARLALQSAGSELGVAELAYVEMLGVEVAARRSVASAIERMTAGASASAELVQQLCAALRAACCPSCGVAYGMPTDACMHAYCYRRGCPSGAARFCGYCFELGCAAETCPLNRTPGSFLNPGEAVKQRAFAIARCRKAGQLLGGFPDDAAAAALRHADVQREVRTLLGNSFGSNVDLAAVRSGGWRLAPGSELALHMSPAMQAHLAAAYAARAAERATRGRSVDERSLDEALAAQEAASRATEGAMRSAAALARSQRAPLAARIAELRAQMEELDAAYPAATGGNERREQRGQQAVDAAWMTESSVQRAPAGLGGNLMRGQRAAADEAAWTAEAPIQGAPGRFMGVRLRRRLRRAFLLCTSADGTQVH